MRVQLRAAFVWLGLHKTKVLGILACLVAYVQNHLAQLGDLLNPHLQGVILGIFGVAAFIIGLANTLNTEP